MHIKLTMQQIKERRQLGERIDTECKEAENAVPKSVYESYSAFANTDGGIIFLGIKKIKKGGKSRFEIQGIPNAEKQITDFWNTINSQKVNANILADCNVYKVQEDEKVVVVIDVPCAEYNIRPIFVGENPFKGTFRRNHEGDYHATAEIRWIDRITYDGAWENNLFNFFNKVSTKLTADLSKPFKLVGVERIDDTPVHKAVREGFVNAIIHADYQMESGTLKIIKLPNGFSFSNPGLLKLSKEEIYKGGVSKSRNPKMQTMLRMIGLGDNAGSGIPAILKTWSENGWVMPELTEYFATNQVTLLLSFEESNRRKSAKKIGEDGRLKKTEENIKAIDELLRKNGEMSTVEIASAMGMGTSRIRELLNEIGRSCRQYDEWEV